MPAVCFRFDIDTHKCIRDGVPNLLEVSRTYQVPFTFFLNVGRAVDVFGTIKNKKASRAARASVQLPAKQKLGLRDCLLAASINPQIGFYRQQISALLNSTCEVGLHGGRNHATWGYNAPLWNKDRIRSELNYAIGQLQKINKEFHPQGFASPCWETPSGLTSVLQEMGFTYYADFHLYGTDDLVQQQNSMLPLVGVNLLGEPGGVAFWEHCRAKHMTSEEIEAAFMDFVSKHKVTVVYDLPYYAGTREIGLIKRIIENLLHKGCNIIALRELAHGKGSPDF